MTYNHNPNRPVVTHAANFNRFNHTLNPSDASVTSTINGGLRVQGASAATISTGGWGDSWAQEQKDAKRRRETPPSHWWAPDKSGHVCRICDFDNIYRGSKPDHMPLIFEEPDDDEWRDQLLS